MSAVQSWLAEFSARNAQLAGADLPWLAAMRQRAIDRFAAEGWPTTRQEDWRHTSLAALEQASFDLSAAPLDIRQSLSALRGDEDGHWLVFVDGRHAPELSDVGALPAGVRVDSLAQALKTDADLVQQVYGDETAGNSPAALNLALAADGACVVLSRGATLDKPVHVVFFANGERAAAFPRNLYVAEAGAHGTVVEHYVGRSGNVTFTNTVSRVQVAADAHFSHVRLQQEANEAFHLAELQAEQEG